MKNKILNTIIIIIAALIPIVFTLIGFVAPAQYDETYYGELGYMYNRLKNTQGKKIVLIGNSSLTFGVRTDLMQAEFPDYEVVQLALYGAIGTKAMLDLSKVNISEGDIVILIPEQNEQAQSLFFSAENMWMAADGNFSMLAQIAKENVPSMVGNFLQFVSQKYGYIMKGSKPTVSGVYQQSSFNDENGVEVGYMTFPREQNSMVGGYDANNLIDFSGELPKDFVEYLNDYNRFVHSKGATLYYGFAPINELGLADGNDEEALYGYVERLAEQLEFPIIGTPVNYVMDYEWFYDTNFHMNSAGMYVYTNQLVEDIKTKLDISTSNSIVIPEKPQIVSPEKVEGNNVDVDCFTYESYEEGVKIVGLTEKGKQSTSLIIPTTYEGQSVVCFDPSVFAGNTNIIQITIQSNVQILYNGCFSGCNRLQKIILQHTAPNTIGVGTDLLQGAENCYIYVPNAALDIFTTHYNWGVYRNVLRGY